MSELRPERYQQIYELFSRVVMIEEDGARLAEIDRVCVDDPALRDHVLLLLGASAEAEEGSGLFTERGVDSVRAALVANFEAQPAAGAAHTIPDEIGGYRVLRRIGQGGMGVVYEAEQRQPKRRVALKVVEGVRGGTELAARLRHEAEIQGNLHHPGIAQVFEAGVATIGLSQCPFFAMELVEGRSILAFADDADLPLRKRLELLASVSDGVGYAHERGVVHRDLKPENILVKPNGQPKVLDFGIASVTGDATFAATSITRDGQILGTLAYMAPAQLGHRV